MARYGFRPDEGALSADRGGKDPRSACEARPSQKLDGMPGSAAAQDEELELIRAVAAGDRRGFETLYYRYAPRLGSPRLPHDCGSPGVNRQPAREADV